MRLAIIATCFFAAAGCAAPKTAPSTGNATSPTAYRFTPYQPESVDPPLVVAPVASPRDDAAIKISPLSVEALPPVTALKRVDPMPSKPLDAAVNPDLVYTIEVFELLLPIETVSRNDELWKRIDETSVDVATYDVLFKNGIRVGVAPLNELEGLQKLTEDRKTKSFTLTGSQGRQIELEMALGVEQQTLFYFDLRNNLIGKRYDKSDNLLMMSFASTPRRPGWIRLSMLPTIRATQKKLIYALLPGRPDKDFSYLVAETPINVNLRVDMPVTRFMIIAPSREANWPSSLGKAFFSKDTPSEKQERVLIVVPHAFKREGVAADNRPR